MRILLLLTLYASVLTVFLSRSPVQSRAAVPGGVRTRRRSKLLVIGASGGTGVQLVSQALERGYSVTAVVRDPSKMTISHPHLALMQGDVMDTASVENAMKGQEAVVSALGHRKFFRSSRILSEGTRNIVSAMEKQGVNRFVCVTTLGIGDSVGRLGILYTLFLIPLVVPFYFSDKVRQERVIAASGLEWVIVRPGMLTDGEKQSKSRHGPGTGSYLWTVRITRADVADFMLNQVEEDCYLRTSVGIAG